MSHLEAQREFKAAEVWPAVVAFLLDEARYLDIAYSHSMAGNLAAPDLAKKFREGTFPPPGFEETARADAREGRIELLRALRGSLIAVAAVTVLALGIVWLAGKFEFELPLSWPKVFGAVGTFLVAWSALFELGEFWSSWDGEALHELVRPKLFMLIFLPGVLLAIVGQLW